MMMVEHDVIEATPLGRNRLLARASSVVIAAAASVWFPAQAAACSPPQYCTVFCQCACCNGSTCCEPCCLSGNYGCPSGGQCWETCAYYGSTLVKFQCCDWGSWCGANRCICRKTIGPC